MKTKLLYRIDVLRGTFWFMPSVFTALSLLLAIVMVYLDARIGGWVVDLLPWMMLEAETAIAILSTITGAMFTVAGVVFSITFVTLSIASSQLGPRLMRTFMRNTSTHVALGFFIGTGIYALLILAVSRAADDVLFVPGISVMVGVLLCVLSMLVLIGFIHNVANLVQSPNVVKQVADELDRAITRLYPCEAGLDSGALSSREAIERELQQLGPETCVITAQTEGYLQAVDSQGLIDLASQHDLVLRACYRPSHFITRGTPLVLVWSSQTLPEHLASQINRAFITGNRPTPHQDAESAVAELAEVAVRALSPSLNDPYTAIHCIDHLGASLGRLAACTAPSPLHHDAAGNLRLILSRPEFPEVLEAGLNTIRQYGAMSVPVIVRLLEALTRVARVLQRDEDRAEVRRQGAMILRLAERTIHEPNDLQDVRGRFEQLGRALIPQTKLPVTEATASGELPTPLPPSV